MAISLDGRKLSAGANPNYHGLQRKGTMIDTDEITQVRCMYDQFYNLAMAGFSIDIAVGSLLLRDARSFLRPLESQTIECDRTRRIVENGSQ